MAIYEIRTEEMEGFPVVERIEVRPWRMGGEKDQSFVIGSGMNFDARGNILIEIVYSVNDETLFYTRNFLHRFSLFDKTPKAQFLEKFISGEHDGYGFGDILPETSVILKREKSSHTTPDGIEEVYVGYRLNISADIGAVFSMSSPGMQQIEIRIEVTELEPTIEFMRQLTMEIEQVEQGIHPNPAAFPRGSSHWDFSRAVNRKAYDSLAFEYDEWMIGDSSFKSVFDNWLGRIPSGGRILDVGCGHGKPVISYLLDKGFAVTGLDSSAKMLERVREQFPSVALINRFVEDLDIEEEFDGACSLSSLLYMDPIDLSHGLHRVHRALKPNGLLLLNAYDLHPTWRGEPYHVGINRWMWGWTYSMDEVAQILEEHGYFKVLDMQDVTPQEETTERIDKWFEAATKEYEQTIKKNPNFEGSLPDREKHPPFPMQYIIEAQRLSK